jgi:hypothetical protein
MELGRVEQIAVATRVTFLLQVHVVSPLVLVSMTIHRLSVQVLAERIMAMKPVVIQ